MKLKNKRTGEIGKILKQLSEDNQLEVITDNKLYVVKTLAELNKEWEDYEEPKEYWYIDCDGEVYEPTRLNQFDLDRMENIGNHFETKEEAEKAVEKLKAWKRLKDNGLVIKKWSHTPDMHLTTGSFLKIEGFIPAIMKNMKDLDLLFGGEDE